MKKNIDRSLLVVFCLFFIFGSPGCNKNIQSEEGGESMAAEWVTIDEFYIPLDYIEEFIKADSEEKGLLPVQIKNYGSNTDVLRKFKGTNFAGPTEAQLNMMYDGLGEWKIIDIKYKNEKDREIQRTILYVYVNGDWMVGDSGSLVD